MGEEKGSKGARSAKWRYLVQDQRIGRWRENVAGLTGSQIFLPSTMAMVVQTVSFYYAGSYVERRDLRKSGAVGLIVRPTCYAAIGLFAATSTGLTSA